MSKAHTKRQPTSYAQRLDVVPFDGSFDQPKARIRESFAQLVAAQQRGPSRNDDPRLQAPRHHDPVRSLNVLDGTVIGRNMKRHRHQEFIRFLNIVDAQVPRRKAIHVIVDNYATHKHPKVREWLEQHPRWTFHFTPTSASAWRERDCGRSFMG